MRKKVDLNKPVIGNCEYIGLPELGLPALKARIDTGARTSALHATDIRAFRRDDMRWVRFTAYRGDTDHAPPVRCELPVVDHRRVRNTGGVAVARYVVRTTFALGEISWDCELTLTSRDKMRYPMLLGRLAIRGRFLVDPDHVFLHGRPRPVAVAG